MLFLKEHLKETYKWAIEPELSPYTGLPSRRIFDRNNGNQVLFIINAVAALSESFSLDKVSVIENLIINQLPIITQSELSVFHWISRNQ